MSFEVGIEITHFATVSVWEHVSIFIKSKTMFTLVSTLKWMSTWLGGNASKQQRSVKAFTYTRNSLRENPVFLWNLWGTFKKKKEEAKQKQPFVFLAQNFTQDLKNKTIFRSLVCMT